MQVDVSDNKIITVSENTDNSDSGVDNEITKSNQSNTSNSTTINFDTTELISVINTSNELQLRQIQVQEFSLAVAVAVLISVIAYKTLSPFTKF